MPRLIAVDPSHITLKAASTTLDARETEVGSVRFTNPTWTELPVTASFDEGGDCLLTQSVRFGDVRCNVGSRVSLRSIYRAERLGSSWPLAEVHVAGQRPVQTLALVDDTRELPPMNHDLKLRTLRQNARQTALDLDLGIIAETLVTTMAGLRPAQELRAGDRILTRDNGVRTLRWVGQHYHDSLAIQAGLADLPICISAGALGRGLPQTDILVGARQWVLLTSSKAELMFGSSEVLVAAEDLLCLPGIRRAEATQGVAYVQMIFDQPELVMSEGVWLQSCPPSSDLLNSLSMAERTAILGTNTPSCKAPRLTLQASEVSALMQ